MSDRYIVTGPDFFTQIVDTVAGGMWGEGNPRNIAQRRVDDWNRVERARANGCALQECSRNGCDRCWINEKLSS
jgi:hypothetical protein